MKSAEEWANDIDLIQQVQGVQQPHELQAVIEQIQQDAFAAGRDAGLVEAADTSDRIMHGDGIVNEVWLHDIKDAILAIRTTKPTTNEKGDEKLYE